MSLIRKHVAVLQAWACLALVYEIPTCELIADGYCLSDILSRQWN